MTEQFSGKVEVLNDASKKATITLDGDDGDILLGGNGVDGDVRVRNSARIEKIHLDGKSGWFSFGPGGDGGRIFAEYGPQSAPLLKLSDLDEPPRIQFQQEGTGDETKPQYSAWIGMDNGKSNNLAIMGGNVGIGTLNPKFGRVMIEHSSIPLSFRETGRPIDQGGLWRMPLDNGNLRFDVNTGAPGSEFGNNYLPVLSMTKDGHVGIGTTNPQYKLDVPGGWFSFGPGGDGGRIFAEYGPQNAPLLKLSDFDDPPRIQFQQEGTGDETKPQYSAWIGMAKGNSNKLAIMGGNVGIGTMEPAATLDVKGEIQVGGDGRDGDVFVSNRQGRRTIHLDGDSGDIILQNADCAEEFGVAESEEIEPGTVMVLDQEDTLHQSTEAYDKKVVGVVSGAGDYKAGIVLDKKPAETNRIPVALMGKVYCKVDAQYSPIEVGDLLTSSSTPGYAMKASDPLKTFGAVIGKALRSLREGKGMIPILAALQ
ncbi:hypothetical protein C5S53_09545 [Methanophagales archaeon]|nr:hypothetical protein C5S53_09545 [Methanophagales archaeon]